MAQIEVIVPDDLLDVLDARAGHVGVRREEYISALLRRDLRKPPPLDEILGPFREQVRASGIEDAELVRLFEAARDEAVSQKRPG